LFIDNTFIEVLLLLLLLLLLPPQLRSVLRSCS
jgi:hypothetical protein